MTDIQMLGGASRPPTSGAKPKQLVLMLHGVGSDGNDLIGLAPFFQKVLPDALFLSPNAPFPYDMGPVGYQWFSIGDFSNETRLKGSREASPILDAFIDAKLEETGLAESELILIGFSQGTMMSLHTGLRRERPLAGILGFSGMLAGPDLLADEIKSRPPVLLTHGDSTLR